jgi:hypothetical protein
MSEGAEGGGGGRWGDDAVGGWMTVGEVRVTCE